MVETTHASKSIRVRDNQRRSRARRKVYIQGLEERLRNFEKLGVEATSEVQAAGRKVAAENALLRSLLRLRGVTETEVKDYLTSHMETDDTYKPTKTDIPFSMNLSSDMRAQQPVEEHFSYGQKEPNRPGSHDLNQASSEVLPNRTTAVCQTSSDRALATLEDFSEAAPRKDERPPLGFDASHVTSCETAARIITMMRGDLDTISARDELGCANDSSCMVKNMTIFDLLDK